MRIIVDNDKEIATIQQLVHLALKTAGFDNLEIANEIMASIEQIPTGSSKQNTPDYSPALNHCTREISEEEATALMEECVNDK